LMSGVTASALRKRVKVLVSTPPRPAPRRRVVSSAVSGAET